MQSIQIIPLKLPIIKKGDRISELILEAIKKQNVQINDGDIIVIAHTIISRAEGKQYKILEIDPTPVAEIVARETGKDPSLVELIIREAKQILKVKNNIIITKNKQGWICANSAVDQSNAEPQCAVTLPENPDKSAKEIGEKLERTLKKKISVLVSDTHGRALRRGAINIAIGAYNFAVIDDARGRKDLFGKTLKTTLIASADEVCSAAELVMGQADERIPVVIIKGYKQKSKTSSITELQYEDSKRLFS